MPNRTIAIGTRDQVRAFRGAGVEVVTITNAKEAKAALREQSLDPSVALILISEYLAADIQEELDDIRSRSTAIVLVIPSHKGSQHPSLLELKTLIEHSIGVDMIGKLDT